MAPFCQSKRSPLELLDKAGTQKKNSGHQNKGAAAREDDLSVWTVVTMDSGEVIWFWSFKFQWRSTYVQTHSSILNI